MTTSEKLKAARIKRGWTQQQLADKIGKPQPRVAEWESGAQDLRKAEAETVAKIAKALKTTVEKLLR